jgi:hypothetical protein
VVLSAKRIQSILDKEEEEKEGRIKREHREGAD